MSNSFSYRPDIDGLRSIAVLLVLFFHAKFTALSGGFIGVDVFFVISGFLISIIIFKEINENQFSFKTFYLRRIKRLAPALIALLFLISIPAYLFLFPVDFERFSRNLIHSYLTTSNFYLWQNTGGYFSANTDLNPLMHTWSLAVEEQFYFVWPILFILLNKITKGQYLIQIMATCLIGLIALSIYLANFYSHSAYFLLPARAFELMMGAILAVSYHKLPSIKQNINHAISIAGILLILLPAFIINKQSTFPGLNALWPCLGTVLLIISGKDTNQKGVINSVISHKSLIGIGLISYSLYLWHWPIFSFVHYLGLELSGIIRIAAIILSFVIAYLSWRFIEQPVRHLNLPTFASAMKKIMLPSFIVFTTMYLLIDAMEGFPHRFNKLEEFDKKINFPSTVRRKCHDAFLIENIDQCWLGVQKEKIDGMLIGDSFANHSAALIDVFAKDAGLLIHDSTAGSNPILTRFNNQGKLQKDPEYAIKRLEAALKYEHIIISANWSLYSNPNDLNYTRLIQTIEEISKHNKKISVIISLPGTTKLNLHKLKLAKSAKFVLFDNDFAKISKTQYWESPLATEFKNRFPKVNFIDMKDVMCQNSLCNLTLDGTILYRNFNHLNTIGGTLIGEKYLKEIGNPLISAKYSK
ncbi:acyltransferase family protein [Marinicellulosiphila megalodicopiae]|uniref:acyltransferase family protein n=1 Tax=Marinicellulosiphila megalodicopiae TaxID=2724896 RepID=UPI003BB00504